MRIEWENIKKLKVNVGCKMGWFFEWMIFSTDLNDWLTDWLEWKKKIQVFYRGTLLASNYDKIIIISAKGGPRHLPF